MLNVGNVGVHSFLWLVDSRHSLLWLAVRGRTCLLCYTSCWRFCFRKQKVVTQISCQLLTASQIARDTSYYKHPGILVQSFCYTGLFYIAFYAHLIESDIGIVCWLIQSLHFLHINWYFSIRSASFALIISFGHRDCIPYISYITHLWCLITRRYRLTLVFVKSVYFSSALSNL